MTSAQTIENDAQMATPRTGEVMEECAICLEPITDGRVTLRCNHAFHGQCLCNHLVRDGRCPLCRDSPGNDDDDYDDDYYEEPFAEQNEYLRIADVMKIARETAKTDKTIAKMFTTNAKWNSSLKKARKDFKAVGNKLRPLEDAMEDRIAAFEKKEQADFDVKNRALLEEHQMFLKTASKSRGQERASRVRIAKKQGFVLEPNQSFRRFSKKRWVRCTE